MKDNDSCCDNLGSTLGFLTLRIWLAMRAFITGLEKFAGTKTIEVPALDEFGEPDLMRDMMQVEVKTYGFEYYAGVPAPLWTQFEKEPLLPNFLLYPYDWLLGPLLLITGLFLLLGIFTRWTLFAMGLLYTSLTFGLILINQSGGIAWLATHIILVVMALVLANRNKYTITQN